MTKNVYSNEKSRRSVFATVFGTALEYYDFMLYQHMITYLTPLLFINDPAFAVAGLMVTKFGRIAGSTLYGHFADRQGRKEILAFSIIGMIVPTIFMGILPTGATFAKWFPSIEWAKLIPGFIFIILRFMQMMSVAGEGFVSAAFVAEHSNKSNRYKYGSLLQFASQIGSILATVIGYLCLTYIDSAEWKWRVPFLISVIFGVSTIYMRRSMTESPLFENFKKQGKTKSLPVVHAILKEPMGIFTIFFSGAPVLISLATYLMIIPMFGLSMMCKLPTTEVLVNTTYVCIFAAICIPIFGWLSDKWGMLVSLRLSGIMMAIFSIPLTYYMCYAEDKVYALKLARFVVVLLASPVLAVSFTMDAQVFTMAARVSGGGLGWGLAQIVFIAMVTGIVNSVYRGSIGHHEPVFKLIGGLLVFAGISSIILSLFINKVIENVKKSEDYMGCNVEDAFQSQEVKNKETAKSIKDKSEK